MVPGKRMKKQAALTRSRLLQLARAAWRARENAFVFGGTKVGCAVLVDDGRVFTGCNVEHRFRCHDVHAEVNAITSMVAGGGKTLVAVVIAAEREYFTPCGGCLDWIFQFAHDDCIVAFQPKRGGTLHSFRASELMPHHPN